MSHTERPSGIDEVVSRRALFAKVFKDPVSLVSPLFTQRDNPQPQESAKERLKAMRSHLNEKEATIRRGLGWVIPVLLAAELGGWAAVATKEDPMSLAPQAAAAASLEAGDAQEKTLVATPTPQSETAPQTTSQATPQKAASPEAPLVKLSVQWLPDVVQHFAPQITTAANNHGIPPELLGIMVMLESCANPSAVSVSGAVGLTQVVPESAGLSVARAKGIPEALSPDPAVVQKFLADLRNRLFEPVTSLEFGTSYLAPRFKTFADPNPDRTYELGIIAFHSGDTAARAYQSGVNTLGPRGQRHREYFVALWSERGLTHSPTFEHFKVHNAKCLNDTRVALGLPQQAT